jgi:aryl-alcohol dehydrogenase-like predicted oxidoreductase
MEYRTLGASGLKVSTLCLGTMTFGEADETSFMHKIGTDDKTAGEVMNRALDAGINFFDTADVYGHDGLTERVLGHWFARDRRRDEVILATKFRFRMDPGANGSGASRLRIVRCVEDSLRRLQTDRIELYQVHMQDIETPEEETLRALDDLVRAGKVLYLGCSNYTAHRLVDSLWLSRTQHLERFVSMQMQYSLVERSIEREHVPIARDFGLGILPWSPLAGGFLSGKYRKGQAAPDGSRWEAGRGGAERMRQFDQPRNWRILEALDAIAAELRATPAQVSLAWLLGRPHVSSVIFGSRSIAQLEDNLKAAELKLPPTAMKRLDEAAAWEPGYPYDFIGRIQSTW